MERPDPSPVRASHAGFDVVDKLIEHRAPTVLEAHPLMLLATGLVAVDGGIIELAPPLSDHKPVWAELEVELPDSTPPTTPVLSASSVSDTEMWLSWTASQDPESGIDHYNIYRDSNLIEVYVRRLREKLGSERIATRRGQGYIFIEDEA